MQSVKLSQLKPGPNVRQHYKAESIAEMANSIKAVGILQNLLVRPAKRGSYEVIFGGRRFKALQLLLKNGEVSKDYGVPVDIRPMDDAEATRLGLIENLLREDMEPLEEAEAFYGAVQQGISVADLALKTGFSERLIGQRITLAERLHAEVKTLLKEGELTLEQAQALTLVDPQDQLDLLENWGQDFDPEALRHSLHHAVLTVANAIFPAEAYQGVIVEDLFGDAGAHFGNQEHARKLQMEAVSVLKEKLEAAGFDPVLLTQEYHLRRWAYRQTTAEEGKGGAVINLHPDTLKVEVLEGVVPNQPTPTPTVLPMPRGSQSDQPGKPRPLLTRKGAARARNLKTLALQRALLGERGGIQAALALAVLGLLGESEVYLRDGDRSSEDKELLDPKAAAIQESFAPLLPGTRMGEGGLALEKYADSRATFKVLVELPREDLERLFTALLCGRIGSWNPRYAYEPSTHDSPFAMILAEHLGARLNWADIPQEFWQAFGKERIGQMVGAFNKAYAHINFASRKEAIRTLLELTRVKPDQPLPEELQFQTKQGGNGLVVVASEPSGDVDDLEAEKVLEAA